MMQLSNYEGQEEVMSEINMTPLVDVMLVLLIIFMITMPVIQHSIKINLPQASTQVHTPEIQPVQLSVNAQGQVYWNQQAVDAPTLARLITETGAQANAQIQVRADKDTAYQHVAGVMAQIQNAGIHKVSLITVPN